jgi:hypothetical protein
VVNLTGGVKPNSGETFQKIIEHTKLDQAYSNIEDIPSGSIRVCTERELLAMKETLLLETFEKEDFHIIPTKKELKMKALNKGFNAETCQALGIDVDCCRMFHGE